MAALREPSMMVIPCVDEETQGTRRLGTTPLFNECFGALEHVLAAKPHSLRSQILQLYFTQFLEAPKGPDLKATSIRHLSGG
jgi:hypothetical protein